MINEKTKERRNRIYYQKKIDNTTTDRNLKKTKQNKKGYPQYNSTLFELYRKKNNKIPNQSTSIQQYKYYYICIIQADIFRMK